MRRTLFVIILLIAGSAIGAQNSIILSNNSSGISALVQNSSRTVLRLNIGELYSTPKDGDSVEIGLPDTFGTKRGAILGPDNAVVPTLSFLLAIPFDSPEPVIKVISKATRDIDEIVLSSANREALDGLQTASSNRRSAYELVWGEEAGVMRDLRLYNLTVCPVEYISSARKLSVTSELELEITHPGSRITDTPGVVSEAFLPIYRSFVENPLIFDPVLPTRGAYWIIYPDAFVTNVAPLADWKAAKGFDVVLIPKSQIGTSPNYLAIKSYITARYDSCTVKPDYITIVGDVTMPNNYGIATKEYANPFGFGDIESDNFYTFLRGNDYFPDVFIGRICIDYQQELDAFIAKLFRYERTPYMTDPGWFLRGTVVAGSDGYSFVSPRLTKLWCREAMFQKGFTQVDTFFASYGTPISPEEINASIDGGVAYVNYRGYGGADYWTPPMYSNSDMNMLANGPMYPIMTSIVCGTGDFNDAVDVCFGENWIRLSGKGGAGFIGNSNHDAHTRWTNALDVGIYWGLFDESAVTLAQAELMGKMTLYQAFPTDRSPNGQVELYFNSYNLLGDPEINCWTGIPKYMTVTCQDSIPLGENMIDIRVRDDANTPIEGAVVCLWKGSEIHNAEFSGADGAAIFRLDSLTSGDIRVTVTAQGYIPREDTIVCYSALVAVGYSSHTIDDDTDGESSGDGDGTMNPSETIELAVNLTNFGTADTARSVKAGINCEVEGVTVLRDSSAYQDIAPGQTATADQPFLISLSSDIANGTLIPFILGIHDNQGRSWNGIIRANILAAQVAFDSVVILDNDNRRIDPGDYFDIVLYARNIGQKPIIDATAYMHSPETGLYLTDTTAVMGTCLPGETFDNSSDAISAWLDSDVYNGHLLNFEVEFAGAGPQVVTSSFSKTVGTVTSHDPIGPDHYGYYCFDNTDSTTHMEPHFTFVEPDLTNWPRVSLSDDDIATIPLPFAVTYYGQLFNEISICDNGYAALGETWWVNFYNGPIPAPQNAQAMLAPFWDDFVQTPLRVYYYHDVVNGWFVMCWKNAFDSDNNRNQTFEIIILDEAAWPTLTNDNEILFLYSVAQSPSTMSVGITSPDRHDGIGYAFNSTYTPGAASLISGRVIKFSTGSEYEVGIDESQTPSKFSLSQNYPNPFNARTMIQFSLAVPGHVTLDIFNVLGQKVDRLLDGELAAGEHQILWDGSATGSGIYFYRLSAPGVEVSRRMTLLK